MKNKIIIVFFLLLNFSGFSQIVRTLSNVSNTTDTLKPISNAQKTAINSKLQTVSSVSALQSFTDASIAQLDGSTWEKKSGNVTSNGGSFAGTLIRVSSSVYWERKTDYVTPEMFGAVGNGTADDTQPTQNAIDFAFANKIKRVIVHSAMNLLVYTLNLKDNVDLVLEKGAIIKGRPLTAGEKATINTPIINVGNGASISGQGTIDGNQANRAYSGSLVIGITIYNVTGELAVSDVKVINCQDGIHFQNVTGSVKINNVTLRTNTRINILGTITKNVTITGNNIIGGLHGIQWYGNPTTSQFCENWNISNNYCSTLGGGGIWGYMGKQITVSNNNIEGCGDVGVDFEKCFESVASSNTVKNCINAGLAVFNACQRITFSSNTVLQETGYGAGFKAFGNNAGELTSADINKNITIEGGIFNIQSGQPAITNDIEYLSGLQVNGVFISATNASKAVEFLSANNCSLTNSVITSAVADPVTVLGSNDCLIESNRITNTGTNATTTARGIYLVWRDSNFGIKNNTVRFNKIIGFNGGIYDYGWGDNATNSVIEHNETALLSFSGALNSTYNGKLRGNYNSSKALIDNSEKWTLPQTLSPTTGNALIWNGTTWTASNTFKNAIIGENAIITYNPLQILGASNTYPLLDLGDGSVVYTRIFRTAGNQMKMVNSNYGGLPFLFSGKHSFDDDVEVETIGKGVIIKSANGTKFRITVSNGGVLSATSL